MGGIFEIFFFFLSDFCFPSHPVAYSRPPPYKCVRAPPGGRAPPVENHWPNRWVYKDMYLQCVMAHNGCFGTVGGCGKRKDMDGVELQRPARSTGQQWWVAEEPFPTPMSCPPGSMCSIGPSVGEEHPQKPRCANPTSSAHNSGFWQPAHSRRNWLTGQGYPSQPLAVSCKMS